MPNLTRPGTEYIFMSMITITSALLMAEINTSSLRKAEYEYEYIYMSTSTSTYCMLKWIISNNILLLKYTC